jgi:hypothetical protein
MYCEQLWWRAAVGGLKRLAPNFIDIETPLFQERLLTPVDRVAPWPRTVNWNKRRRQLLGRAETAGVARAGARATGAGTQIFNADSNYSAARLLGD